MNSDISAPIHRLPPEMLRQVLICAVTRQIALPRQITDLVMLMLVCKAWCQIILDTPHFWTCFDLPYVLKRLTDRNLSFLNRALARGRLLPLDVTLTLESKFLSAVTESLLKNMISRCDSLDLWLDIFAESSSFSFYKDEIECIFDAIEPSKLIHLSIAINNDSERDVRLEDCLWGSIPVQRSFNRIQYHLQSLLIREVDFLPDKLRMPRLEILTLYDTEFDHSHLRKWTMIAPNLLHLFMRFVDMYEQNENGDHLAISAQFQHLQFLELSPASALSGSSEKALLSACPLVQDLVLVQLQPTVNIQLVAMPNLERLVLSDTRSYTLTDSQHHRIQRFAKFFSCMPNLLSLEISEHSHDALEPFLTSSCGLIFQALTATSDSISNPNICPKLISLIYTAKSIGTQMPMSRKDAIDSLVSLSKSRQGGSQSCSLRTTLVLESFESLYIVQYRTTIANDANYSELLHALQTEPGIEQE